MMTIGTPSRNGGLKRPFEYRLLAYATAASAGVFGISAPAVADFSGDYAVANWDTILTNSDGSVDTSGAPLAVRVIGSDAGCIVEPGPTAVGPGCGPGDTDFTIAAVAAGAVHFSWKFDSDETGNDNQYDEGGYLLNGIYTHLAFNEDAPASGGPVVFGVSLGDVFGFRVHSSDNVGGRAYLTIGNFQVCEGTAPCDENGRVPEPGTLALLAAGMLGAVAMRRGRRRASDAALD